MKLKRGVIFLFFGIILISLASASFNVGNLSHSIDSSYAPGEAVRGWINISLADEPVNSLFEDSGGTTISLIDLINKTPGFVKICSPVDCKIKDTSTNGETTKTFSLSAGQTNLVGLQFTGILVGINYINFTVSSDAGQSCNNQLGIDFLNDNSVDFGNYKPSSASCPIYRSYGCFDSSKTPNLVSIEPSPKKYFQRITLSPSP